jgi:hypothetical protein
METLFYIVLAAVLYGIVAERSDRAVEREMRSRQKSVGPQIVEDFDVRPVRPWYRRVFARRQTGAFPGGADAGRSQASKSGTHMPSRDA